MWTQVPPRLVPLAREAAHAHCADSGSDTCPSLIAREVFPSDATAKINLAGHFVAAIGSPKTVTASSNGTPCFAKLEMAVRIVKEIGDGQRAPEPGKKRASREARRGDFSGERGGSKRS